MIVRPSPANVFPDYRKLRKFFLNFQQNLGVTDQLPIVSISLAIPTVDPLVILDALVEPQQLHFYFESSQTGEAITAIDAAVSLTVNGKQRFYAVRDFIRACLSRISANGDLHLPFSGPHFFSSFAFFDENYSNNSTFPAATVFLPRWQIARSQDCCVFVANWSIDHNFNIENVIGQTWEIWQKICAISTAESRLNHKSLSNHKLTLEYFDNTSIKESINSVLKGIKDKLYHKVVLSHAIDVKGKSPLHLAYSLNNLRQIHPGCYIFSTSDRKGKYFIGASPERLISLQNHLLTTDALAGSAPRGENKFIDRNLGDELLASGKERHEHQVVIDFIINHLVSLGLNPQLLSSRLLKLSNIQHLWTPIQAQVPSDLHLLDILAELHPTPAVAGLPREIACQEIRRYEAFERSLYAAPLGWIDYQGNGEFVVGIRSAIIEGNKARLFAGAGIVAGSDPDKELAEIQLKFQALLKALV